MSTAALSVCAAILLLTVSCQSAASPPAASPSTPLDPNTPVASAFPAGSPPSAPQASAVPPVAPSPRPAASFNAAAFRLELTPLVRDLNQPLQLVHSGDGTGNLYAVEKGGTIRMIVNGQVQPGMFLDIRSQVRSQDFERGLLGLAFHPDFRTNRFFYVNYTNLQGHTVVARYTANADGTAADPGSAKRILFIEQPFSNHNGGNLVFGPDGKLWIGMGDGGGGGDPRGHGQNPNTLLAKMLRIDVDSGDPYGIPPDNPFVGRQGARPEVWALGLRNPWRYSFDRATGDLYLADVGQNSWEEVNVVPAGRSGLNFGWNRMEGNHCYQPRTDCDRSGLELPVHEYPTGGAGNCSVTGGFVYRGRAHPAMTGGYFYGDYCSGRIWSLAPRGDGSWVNTEMLDTSLMISSFGEDEAGEIYVTALDGGIYRLTAAPRQARAGGNCALCHAPPPQADVALVLARPSGEGSPPVRQRKATPAAMERGPAGAVP